MRPIVDYTDFRVFLRDFYQHHKAINPSFSHRVFLAKAGMTGPNYLKNIIDGKRNISRPGIAKFARALELSKREAAYFQALVQCNQASNPADKKRWFIRLSEISRGSAVVALSKENYDYLATWYAVAIREYIHSHEFRGDVDELADALYPSISARQARQALDLLLRLGLVRVNDDGRHEVVAPQVTTGPELTSVAAHAYHESMAAIGARAIKEVPADKRYFRGVTGSFSSAAFDEIRLALDSCAQRITDIIGADTHEKKVYQVNMQLFPLHHYKSRRQRSK